MNATINNSNKYINNPNDSINPTLNYLLTSNKPKKKNLGAGPL